MKYEAVLSVCQYPKKKGDWICIRITAVDIQEIKLLMEELKQMENAFADEKYVYVPLKQYKKLVNVLKKKKVKVVEIPEFVRQALETWKEIDLKDDKRVKWDRIPKRIRDTLLPFQKQSIV